MVSKSDLNGDLCENDENIKSEKNCEVKEEEVLVSKNAEILTMENSPEKTTFMEKVKFLTSNITIEPILACYILPIVFCGLATQNLNLEKACRVNLNYGAEICDALTNRQTANYTFEEQSVQKLVAQMAGYKSALNSLLSVVLILFWGSWSDRHKRRKPCMLIPIFGELLAVTGLIICTYFENLSVEYTVFVDGFFPAVTGGWSTSMVGFFSYIGDVSSKEHRTMRIGILDLCSYIGVPIGMAFSGVLLKIIGFYGIFSITAFLYLVGILYGVFIVKEPVQRNEQAVVSDKGVIADFFDTKHVLETFKVVFKKGPSQRRKRVLALLLVLMVCVGPVYGEMAVVYLFTRFRFNWSEVDFSIYSTFGMIVHLIGALISVGIFSHVLKMDDALIGVISCMSKILSGFVFAFAVTTRQVYLGPFVEFLKGTAFTAMRSIASKLVPNEELGQINSIFGFVEGLMPLIYGPMYTTIYAATLTTLPGAFFLVGSALTSPAVFIFLWMYIVNRREDETNKKNDVTKLDEIEDKLFATVEN